MKNKPFLLQGVCKDYLWGGHRLAEEFCKNEDVFPLAETWECSVHPDGVSVVASGEYCGKSLARLIEEHPEYLGIKHSEEGTLPVLIKFIDADKDLSVQVHPSDGYAALHENGQRGKSEMWYVLDASKDASLVYGLKRKTEKAVLRTAVENGTLDKYLQKVPVKKDDVFFIEAGTIHALGEGTLIAEIQENSNLTYRLYDYDRTDRNGQKRPLHLEKALAVADLEAAREPRQPVRVLNYTPGAAREMLCRCRYFEVSRLLVNTERRQSVRCRADELSFRVLLCVRGCGTLSYEDGGAAQTMNVYKGDCVFIPADSVEISLHGQLQFLDIVC